VSCDPTCCTPLTYIFLRINVWLSWTWLCWTLLDISAKLSLHKYMYASTANVLTFKLQSNYLMSSEILSRANPGNPRFKVVLLGEGCVGKTCLVLRFVENKFATKHMSTLQVKMWFFRHVRQLICFPGCFFHKNSRFEWKTLWIVAMGD